MMKAELINVGTELLMGQILNTNAQYLSRKLSELGIDLYYHTTVGDNEQRLIDTIKLASSRSTLVILTGGLGPTSDDITKETLAKTLDLPMILDPASLEYIKGRFQRMGRIMPQNNVKQAMFPLGATILDNPNGTAPGCAVEEEGIIYVVLPGPPRELVPMVDNKVVPLLLNHEHSCLYSRMVKVFGVGESSVEQILQHLIEAQTNPTIAPYAETGEMKLRVTAKCRDEAEGESLVAPVVEQICQMIGDSAYSTNNESLQQVCGRLLKAGGFTVSTAESCTGGMLSAAIVDVPGSSEWFIDGAVTYTNASKAGRLCIDRSIIETNGAVSEIVARLMAEGSRKTSGADYAVSTTGYAGGEDNPENGLVYIGLASKNGTAVRKFNFVGDRERVRIHATLNALDMLRRELIKTV